MFETLTNDQQLRLRFAILSGRLDDFQPLLRGRVLRRLKQMVIDNFATSGSLATPAGWPPLSARSLRKKGRKGILRLTDRLFNSLTKPHGTADTIVRTTAFELVFGTRTPYAQYHQHGDGVPQRQPLPDPVRQPILVELRQMCRDWVLLGRSE